VLRDAIAVAVPEQSRIVEPLLQTLACSGLAWAGGGIGPTTVGTLTVGALGVVSWYATTYGAEMYYEIKERLRQVSKRSAR
jgi:hypothetical protein